MRAPYVTEPFNRPARLVEEHWKRATNLRVEPLHVDLSSLSVEPPEAQVSASPLGVRISCETDPVRVWIPLNVSTECYNTLVIEMRTDSGEMGNVGWCTDLYDQASVERSIGFPLFPEDEFHTYRLFLQSRAPENWHSTLKKILLVPSDVPTEVEIARIQLAYTPPDRPFRLTIQDVTREALFGTQPPWTVTVPPRGQFEVALTAGPYVGRGRMSVRMKPPQGPEIELLNEMFYPQMFADELFWTERRVDLSAFAGQQVTFTLEVDHLNTKRNDYFYWGNPVVFGEAPENAVPVILISCDTTRADHFSCYGYGRETTPNLDAWAADEAVLFENAIVPETWTMPSHASLLSGLYPKSHGGTADSVLAESVVTLADVARDRGYLTAGFVGFQYWLAPTLGFAQGFDIYDVPTVPLRSIAETNIVAAEWLSAHPTPSLFLFLHNGDNHGKIANMGYTLPYEPGNPSFLHFAREFEPPPTFQREGLDLPTTEEFLIAANERKVEATEEEIAYCVALYDDCIRMVDYEISRFFQKLKQLNLYDQALIIVTSDHGEEFAEHGNFGHTQVFEECARVPLIIKFPGAEYGGTRIADMVELIDIFPTVLEVLGLSRDAGQIDGKSLMPLLQGGGKGRSFAYLQRYAQRAVRTPEYKLIFNNLKLRTRVYDLQRDPKEQMDLGAAPPPETEALRQELDTFFTEDPDGWHVSLSHNPDPVPAQISIHTEDTIISSSLKRGDRREYTHNIKRAARQVELFWDQFVLEDEMVLRTANSEAPLSLDIKSAPHSERSILLHLGHDAPIETKDLRMVLDPAERTFPRPEPIPTVDADRPTIAIWYEPPAHKRTAAPELSPEDREALDALGYGDSK